MAAEAPAAGETVAAVAGSTVGGAFSLTDHNGNAVTEASWPGKYKLVFFGFTHCPDICPATLDKITTALTAMGDEAAKVQPLFITTDPARDDTATVKQFVSGYHPSIVGLTGTEAQLNATIDAYKVFASKVPGPTEGDYKIEHSSYVFLMSPDDKMLEIFKTEDTAETIADKTKQHVAAAPAPAAEPAAEEGTPGMKDGEPNNAGGANETEVPGDLIPEKPQTPPEVIDESVPMDTAPATEAPASEEPATTEE
jgi:protein SCO1/2